MLYGQIFKMRYLFILLVLISCSHAPKQIMCKYKLRPWCELYYNKNTKEYVIHTGKTEVDDYSDFKNPFKKVTVDTYWGEKYTVFGRGQSTDAMLGGAFKFSDSCSAINSIENFIRTDSIQRVEAAAAARQRVIDDSLRNDFRPIENKIRIPDATGLMRVGDYVIYSNEDSVYQITTDSCGIFIAVQVRGHRDSAGRLIYATDTTF